MRTSTFNRVRNAIALELVSQTVCETELLNPAHLTRPTLRHIPEGIPVDCGYSLGLLERHKAPIRQCGSVAIGTELGTLST